MKRRPGKEISVQLDHRRMLAAVLEAAPVAMGALNMDGRLVLVEGHPFPEVGLHPGETESVHYTELWSQFEPLTTAAARALSGEPASATVVAGENAFDFRFYPVPDGAGKSAHVALVATDVTSRYAAMVDIPAREEFLQGILDSVVDGIITIDELGLIRDYNPAAAEIFGYQAHEVIGKSVNMLIPEPYRSDHDGHIARYLASNQTHVIGRRREIVGLRKNGEIFPMDLAVSELVVGEHRHFTGIARDITERKEAERALRESEERYALAARGANDGLWDWNLLDDSIYYSPRWKAMLGYDEGEITGRPDEWLKRIHRDDFDQFMAELDMHLQGRTATFECEYRIRRKSGEILRMLARGVAVRDEAGVPYRMAGSQSDITDRKRAEERLIYDALHDALTGLANRTLLTDRLGQALARLKRNPDMGFVLAALNLDRFRVVNESLGHAAGDDLLLAVARRLENQLQPGDTLARLGADNFAVLMEEAASEQDARKRVQRIQRVIRQPFRLGGREVFSSASVGIVIGDRTYQTADDVLRDAEIALSSSRRESKGKIQLFHEDLHREAVGILETEIELRKAIENGRVVAFYQPIVSLDSGRISGFEALARIDHPERGIIPPSEFIGIAEETGLIIPLCEQVLSQASAQIAAWQRKFDTMSPLHVSVNLSARNMADENLMNTLQQVLDASALDPGYLSLEVTESLIMANPELMVQTLSRLKSLGVGLSLDDFGTGYSSLSHLRRFPLDTLKIDRSFVMRMTSDSRDLELVRLIVTLAHTLGMPVVAEGVETAQHADVLCEMGCEYAQGFYYAGPLPAAEAEQLLRDGFDA